MNQFEFNGKLYIDEEIDTQFALKAVSIYTFRYYVKDRVWLASEACAEHFKLSRCYLIAENFTGGPSIVFDGDADKDRSLYRAIMSGKETSITDNLRTHDGSQYLRLTLSALEKDSDGKVEVIYGVVQELDTHMTQMEYMKLLSDDYSFIYFVDFTKDLATIYRQDMDIASEHLEGCSLSYEELMNEHALANVKDEYKNVVRMLTSVEYLEEKLREDRIYMHEYQVVYKGKPSHIRFKAVNMSIGPKLTQAVIGFSNVDNEKKTEWEHLAFIDSVTAGHNYTYYSERLKEVDRPGFIISLDIRYFKMVNSICGMQMGDRVLQLVSRLIDDVIGEDGFLGHVNADHFVIFVNYTQEKEVVAVLKKITAGMKKLVKELDIPKVWPYFGVTTWLPGDRNQIKFSEANAAKHRIKESLDTNYGFFRKEDIDAAIEERNIEDSFENAIEEEQFEIWYQPKYNPIDNTLTGAEALVRWRKPDGTLLTPNKFISIYERSGHIRHLDKYMFEHVCAQQKEWITKLGRTVPISINMSRASLYIDNLVNEYKEIADKYGVPHQLVPIEITESAAVDNLDIKGLANKFFEAGFPLHIDDFGSGYSSLSTLNLMKFDTLKLDKSLIDYIGEFGGDRLIRHTVALAKDLGLHVTAEGVENEEQVKFLKNVECDNIQGFFFAKPIQMSEFMEKLTKDIISRDYGYFVEDK